MNPPHLRPELHVHALGDELVVFDPRCDATHRINVTACAIWRLCGATENPSEAAAHFARLCDVPEPVARRDVALVLERLSALDLLERPLFAA